MGRVPFRGCGGVDYAGGAADAGAGAPTWKYESSFELLAGRVENGGLVLQVVLGGSHVGSLGLSLASKPTA